MTTKIKNCRQDQIFITCNYIFLTLLTLVLLYPLIYVISCSFSSGDALMAGKMKLFPVEPRPGGYKKVFSYEAIFAGYRKFPLFIAVWGILIGGLSVLL